VNIVSRGLRCAIIIVGVTLVAGCAFGTRQPTLIYPPASEPGTVPAAHAAVTQAPKNVPIVLDTFKDQRSDKKVVGTMRNTFGMRTADVIPNNSVPEWVTQALTMELMNNGYNVTAGTARDSPAGAVVVSGEILNVFCDVYFSYTGQVSLFVRVSRDGKELLNKHYMGEGSAGLNWAGTEESYAQSLALALSAASKQFLSDLDTSLVAP
jgi:hypothetical protein